MLNTYHFRPRFLHLLAAGFLALATSARAQLSTYTFFEGTRTFVPLTTPDSTVGISGDDATVYTNIPIKMPFEFNGTVFTRLSINVNGVVRMGSTMTSASFQALNGNQNNMIAVVNGDLELTAPIRIDWSGTAPNRQMTIEYTGAQRFAEDDDNLFSQLILSENGTIEIHYGDVTTSTVSDDIQVGLRGNSVNDVLALAGRFNNLRTSTSSTATVVLSGTSLPVTGQLLTFRKQPPAQFDLAASGVVVAGNALAGCQRSTQEQVQLTIRNRGLQPVSSAVVGYRIRNQPPVTQTVALTPPLQPGEARIVNLTPTVDLSAIGNYRVRAFVTASGDSLAFNDTATVQAQSSGPRTWSASRFSYTDLVNAGFVSATGNDPRSTGPSPAVRETEITAFNLAAGFFSASAAPGTRHWFYIANLNSFNAPVALRFRLRATLDSLGANDATTILSDTLKILTSFDCGQTWTTRRSFTQADLAAGSFGLLSPDEIVSLAGPGQPFSFAFQYVRGSYATNPGHIIAIDDVELFSARNLSVTRVDVPSANRFAGCARSAQETVALTISNLGTDTAQRALVSYRRGSVRHTDTVDFAPGGLAPGQQRVYNFSGAQGLDVTADGRYTIIGRVTYPGDNSRFDDSLTLAFTLRGPRAITDVRRSGSLDTARGAGWRTSSGRANTLDSTSNWFGGFPFTTASIANEVTPQDANAYEYLYLTNMRISGVINFSFKAAVTLNLSGTSPVPSLGNDSLMLRMSTDCGQTWTTLLTFAEADLAARTITNALKPFSVNLQPQGNLPVTLAWVATTGGTASAITYRWHLDDLIFSAANNLAAAAVITPAGSSTQPFSYCTRAEFPLSFIISNRGSLPVTMVPYGYQIGNGPVVRDSIATNLAVGATDTITVPVVRLLGQTGRYAVKVFTQLPGDGNQLNDTLTINVLVPPTEDTPVDTTGGYNALVGKGWFGTRISTGVNGGASSWVNATAFSGNPSAALGVNGNTLSPIREYLVSPAFAVTGTSGISFRVAVTNGISQGTGAVTSIGDDSLKVIYRSACSNQWQLLQAFTQANITDGTLSNRLNQFGITLPASTVGDTLQIAFAYTNSNSGNSLNYRWHINNAQLLDGPLANGAASAGVLALAPNPAAGATTLYFGRHHTAASLRLTSLDGRLLQSATVTGDRHTLQLTALPKGVYLVELLSAEGSHKARLVKE